MRRALAVTAWLAFCSLAQAATYEQDLSHLTRGMPRTVHDFIDRRAGCNHWAGEEGYDAARRSEIDAAIARLRCTALPAEEKALKRRYARRPAILRALKVSADWLGG